MSDITEDLTTRTCGSLGCQQLQYKTLAEIERLRGALERIVATLDGSSEELEDIDVLNDRALEIAEDALSAHPAPTPPDAYREGMEALAGKLERKAKSIRDVTRHGNYAFATAWDADFLEEAATAIREASNARAGGGK